MDNGLLFSPPIVQNLIRIWRLLRASVIVTTDTSGDINAQQHVFFAFLCFPPMCHWHLTYLLSCPELHWKLIMIMYIVHTWNLSFYTQILPKVPQLPKFLEYLDIFFDFQNLQNANTNQLLPTIFYPNLPIFLTLHFLSSCSRMKKPLCRTQLSALVFLGQVDVFFRSVKTSWNTFVRHLVRPPVHPF